MQAAFYHDAVFYWFPIKRCHQRVVTLCDGLSTLTGIPTFPIKRCHQRVVTLWMFALIHSLSKEFPIKRCHQRVVTWKSSHIRWGWLYRVSNQKVSPASGDSAE